MLRDLRNSLAAAALLAGAALAMGFTPLGPGGAEGNPAKQWQLPAQNDGWDIGYGQPFDIGAPVDLLEAYRWNVPTITYAFDEAFIRFFGQEGVKAVKEAVRIFNELPPVSRMSDDLSEYPLNATQLNFEAAQLGLLDLKSVAMTALIEELGLADPIRWNFAIRQRINLPDDFGDYIVIKYNYDPVTLRPSSYVNGNLWTYFIQEIPPPVQFSDAVEFPVREREPLNLPVAALSYLRFFSGYFYTGLTRDDAGGLRFLYHPRRVVAETLLAGTLPGPQGWSPFLGTNFLGTNFFATNIVGGTNLASAGLRGGINQFHFQQVHFDSILGQAFTPITNRYTDRAILTNSQFVSQQVLRPILQPDIVFTVEDTLPGTVSYFRTDTTGWINNDLINGVSTHGGPGIIAPPIQIIFNKYLPYFRNVTPSFIFEPSISDTNARFFGLLGPVWASFDGTTNPPVIFPTGEGYFKYSIDDLRNVTRGGGL